MRMFRRSESNSACRDLFVQMVSTADYVTPSAGLTLTVEVVKAGSSAYSSISGTWSEVGGGTYRLSLAASDLDTEGEGMLKVTADDAADQFVPFQVVSFIDEVHLAKAALTNSRTHVIDTGVNEIKDDDGVTTIRTLTPSESEGVVTVSSS